MRVFQGTALAAMCVGATAMFGGTFTNGSFESPGGAPIRCVIDNAGCAVAGWTNAGGFQIYESSGQDGINAGDGTYWVSWGHLGATGGTLTQTFDTNVGQTYYVDYLVTVQQGIGIQSVQVDAFDGASVLGTISTSFSNVDWALGNELSFTATSGSTTLVFIDTTADSGPNWGLDDVTLNNQPLGSSVPEPASVLLLGGALVALSDRYHRRLRR